MIRASFKSQQAVLRHGRVIAVGSSSKTAAQSRNNNNGPTSTAVLRLFSSSSSSSVIPERSLWDTIYSGTKGLVSLLVSEESRQKFMDIVSVSQTINADVLKQARFGSMLTIALFHDLQDPLFQRYKFNGKEFLTGVQPALTNFHDTLGTLQNEFPDVSSKEERAELLMERFRQIATTQMNAAPESPWTEQAQSDPKSSAAKLSKMVSPRLLNSLFLTTETEAMISRYKEGSTKVSYVALLSARAMVMDDEEFSSTTTADTATAKATTTGKDDESVVATPTVEAIKKLDKEEEESNTNNKDDDTTTKGAEGDNVVKSSSSSTDDKASPEKESSVEDQSEEKISASEEEQAEEENDDTPVAAQIEVLYEMNHSVDVKPITLFPVGGDEENNSNSSSNNATTESSSSSETQTKDETQIWVGTFEGWLNGSPDGKPLRWKITHLRPPHAEFPGLYHASFGRS